MHARRQSAPPGLSPAERIAHANRGYLEEYRRNARMIGIMEQVATVDELQQLPPGHARAGQLALVAGHRPLAERKGWSIRRSTP